MFKIKWARGSHTTIKKLEDHGLGTSYQITIPNGSETEWVELEFTEYEFNRFIEKLKEQGTGSKEV